MSAIEVTTYIDAEAQRLTQKKASVDSAYNAQMRNAVLNDSYRKRYAKYIEILTILILATIAYMAISYFQTMFPALPPILFDVLTVIIVALVVIYLLFAFFELFNRSNMNYDEVSMPAVDVSGITMNNSTIGGNIGITPARSANNGLVDTCTQAECCSYGTHWDATDRKCVASQTAGFSTIGEAYEHKPIAAPMTGQLPVVNHGQLGSSSNAIPVVSGTTVPFSSV